MIGESFIPPKLKYTKKMNSPRVHFFYVQDIPTLDIFQLPLMNILSIYVENTTVLGVG